MEFMEVILHNGGRITQIPRGVIILKISFSPMTFPPPIPIHYSLFSERVLTTD